MTTGALQVRVEAEELPATDVAASALEWREALGEPYRARLELEVRIADFDAAPLLGTNVTISLERAGAAARRLCGVATEVSVIRPLAEGAVIELELAPALSLLGLRRRSRVFQDLSAADVVRRVLTDELGVYGRSFSDQLRGEYAVREYCVQYQESDLALVSRLMEEEGIWFAFGHDGDTEELVLHDANGSCARAESGEAGVLRYLREHRGLGTQEWIYGGRLHGQLTTTSVAARHFDWTSVAPVEGSDAHPSPRGPQAERYEHGFGSTLTLAEYGGRYGAHDGAQRARVWREAYTSPGVRFRGSTVAVGLDAGLAFDLSDHPDPAANAAYLVTAITRRVSREGHGRDDFAYTAELEACPLDQPFRTPRRTPRPFIDGVETAVVTGPGGQEIHTDEHGRVRVQFHWDREGAGDDTSTCWLRCAQPWAGAGWGFVWTPRIGMKALVMFEHGDPDRPLVIETVYDGANTPPYPLPGEKTKSTIKSNTTLGGGGFNELRFEDLAGSEEVFLHAQRDLDEVVLANHTTDVGSDQANEVDGHQLQEIDENQTENVTTTQDVTVKGNRKVTVHGGFDESVTGKETRVVLCGSKETIAGGEHHTVVNGGLIELITGGATRIVKSGGLEETITGDNLLVVTGAVTETVTESLLRRASAITLDASASISMTGTGGITIEGFPNIDIKSPSWMHLASDREEKIADDKYNNGLKMSAFVIDQGLAMVYAEAYVLSLAGLVMKRDVVGFSFAATGVAFSAWGKVQGRWGTKPELFAFELEAKGLKRLNS